MMNSNQVIAVQFKKSIVGRQIISHRSEKSVLDNPKGLVPYAVGVRKRLATCGGVSWIGNNHLATINLYGQVLRIYRLEENKSAGDFLFHLELIIEERDEVTFPDAVAVSNNGSWIAIAHSLHEQKGVTLRRLDFANFNVLAVHERFCAHFTCHGVHFSPDSRFLAFTTLEHPGSVEVYDINTNPCRRVCSLINNHEYLRPKDICFTSDSKYAAIIYSELVGVEFQEHNVSHRRLAIHRFDASTGMIEEDSIALLQDNNFLVNSFELAVFKPGISTNGYQIYITNQNADKVVEIVFNPVQCSLKIAGSFGANLSFPHGIDISADGKMLAVTNFGDDHLRIFNLEQENSLVVNARPHILLCAHSSSSQLFGAERSFIDLAHAFCKLGYKISCLLPQENLEYFNELAKYVDTIFHLSFTWSDHRRPYDEDQVKLIEALIQSESIDIVHTNSTVIPDPLLAAKRAGIPGVLHARELLSENKLITTALGINSDEIIRQLSGEAEIIIANSKKTMTQFSNENNLYCLYNAIDIHRFDISPIARDGVLKVGLISSNNPNKGIHDFVDLAMKGQTEPMLEFLIIGPCNSEIEIIRELIRSLATPPRLKFIDYVSDPVDAISMVDVVVSLSSVGESFGRTIAEGMAARRPVIVYDRGAMSELVAHEDTGFLIPPGDLHQVLYWLKWLSIHRASAMAMGERGRCFVEKTFAFDLYQSNLENIYQKLLDQYPAIVANRK